MICQSPELTMLPSCGIYIYLYTPLSPGSCVLSSFDDGLCFCHHRDLLMRPLPLFCREASRINATATSALDAFSHSRLSICLRIDVCHRARNKKTIKIKEALSITAISQHTTRGIGGRPASAAACCCSPCFHNPLLRNA